MPLPNQTSGAGTSTSNNNTSSTASGANNRSETTFNLKAYKDAERASAALDKFYARGRIPHQKKPIVDAILTHSALLCRQSAADRDYATRHAVENFHRNKLHLDTKRMIMLFFGKFSEELYAMNWWDFSKELNELVIDWFEEDDASDSEHAEAGTPESRHALSEKHALSRKQ